MLQEKGYLKSFADGWDEISVDLMNNNLSHGKQRDYGENEESPAITYIKSNWYDTQSQFGKVTGDTRKILYVNCITHQLNET